MQAAEAVWPEERADAPLIRFEAVSYRYLAGERMALADIDLSVKRGEIIGIVGPTGAGKTTLCLAMNGIVPQFFGGRGGPPQGPLVSPGRYKATLGSLAGEVVTPFGEPQSFLVVPLPR